MPTVQSYHRPESITDVLQLFGTAAPVLLAGGTEVIPRSSMERVDLIDLQALGLCGIRLTPNTERLVSIGAMTTLTALSRDALAPDALRDLARRELPSTLRSRATVGGTVMAGTGESELLTGLLAFDAHVLMVGSDGEQLVALDRILADRSTLGRRIITELQLRTDGHVAVERTGRTPSDTPIVCVVTRRTAAGAVRIALSGVGWAPVVVTSAEAVAALRPPGDFRGSSDYRRHLAVSLSARALARLDAGQAPRS